jgi:hypothetical protein
LAQHINSSGANSFASSFADALIHTPDHVLNVQL